VAESHDVLRGSKPGHLNSADCIFGLRCIPVALHVFCSANVLCCDTFFVIYASVLFIRTSLTPTCSGTLILPTFQLLSNDHGRTSCPPPKLILKARSLKSHSKPCNDHFRVLSSAGTLSSLLNRRQQNTAHPERVREVRRLHDHRRHWLAAHFRGSNFVFLSESANHAVECGTGDRSVVDVEDKKKKRETSVCNAVESDGTLWLVDKAHCRLFNAGNLKLWRELMYLPEPIARSLQDRWDPHRGNIPTDSVCFSKLVEWFDATKWGTRARTSQYESHDHVLVEAAHFVLNPRMYLQWYGQTVIECMFRAYFNAIWQAAKGSKLRRRCSHMPCISWNTRGQH
jgi:hypothetical protein